MRVRSSYPLLKRGSVQAWKRPFSMRLGIDVSMLLLLLPATLAVGQQEQWLQYRSAAEARQIVGDMGYNYGQPVSKAPENVKTPDFVADKPLFMEMKSPLAASGSIWLAFDKSSPSGQYDRVYLDGNANGDLSDDAAVEPYQRETNRAMFGPLKIVFPSADGPITYHLTAELRNYSPQEAYCLLTPACWYEGPITIDGVKKFCTLIDYNVNGTFNDKSPDAGQCDRIRIGEEGGRDSRYVGNFIEVGEKLYKPEIAPDGACISLSEATDVAFGAIRVAQNITSFSAGGVNGLFLCKPENGLARLPVGEYRIQQWSIVRNDDKGARWELQATPGSAISFAVAQNQEKELSIGEPIYSQAEYTKSGSFYSFSQNLQGRQGERITLTRNGSQSPPPKLRIRSGDGAYDRALSFEYG